MLRPNVARIFPSYSLDLEGAFTSLYADQRRLVTCGVGILVDPRPRATALEWWIGDRRATNDEVINDWVTIKDRALKMSESDLKHWTAPRQAALTSVRLRQDYMDALTRKRMQGNFDYIVKNLLPDLPDAPADAILGCLSLAWAVGAGFDKTNPPRTEFIEAARAGDWLAAAAGARLREAGNAGVVARNKHQELCFRNAATVVARGLDPAALWWPNACPESDSLHTLAVKALDLGIARGTGFPPKS